MLARLGALQRDLSVASAALDENVASLKEAAEAGAAPLKAEAEALTRGIQTWAEANRERLTLAGRVKTVKLTTGEIAWRTRPPSVKLRDQGAILEFLVKVGLTRFIRVKSEVNREAMLAEPAAAGAVPGVTISSEGEDFVVTPASVELAA